jgi:extracellular elastinolytic metalloproteinase
VENLEARVVLTAPYLPPSYMQVNPTGLLTGPAQGEPLGIALDYLDAHASDFGLTAADLTDPAVTSQYTDSDTGVTHIYLRQRVNGLEVAYADLDVSLTSAGEVIAAGGGFVAGLADKVPAVVAPPVSAVDAVKAAAASLGLTPLGDPQIVSQWSDAAQSSVIDAPGVSLDDIPARLEYVPTEDGAATLAWQLVIRTPDGGHWYDLNVGADVGSVVAQNDWVDHDTYNVIAPPNESPQDGGFSLQTNPADPTASPFGWNDTNGVAGPEFTDTRGNNVDAHLDRNNDNIADADEGGAPRPNGGPNLDFSGFTQDPTSQPTTQQNQNIAQVNLFFINNLLHDVHYKYGFTDAAGNFQVNNYGRGGLGNDAVQADAQDGGGTNNANFATPPDGQAPRMQMYLFNSTNPQRDGDLDNDVIIHEYGHGVSNRLTGGPANSNALVAIQSGGMGEGWSDYYSLMFQQRPTDQQNDGFGVGTYVIGQPQNGQGIRRQKYSYNMTIDPITFSAYNSDPSKEVHNTGEIWASTLWDLNWLLVNKYGFDSNLATGWTAAAGPGHAGNKLTLRLVMDALKLQPANPSFTQARNAIIAADNALDGGADLFEIWSAFARRGLGANAFTSSSSSGSVTVDFTIPPGIVPNFNVTGSTPANGAVIVGTTPSQYVVTLGSAVNPATVQGSDLLVNGLPASSAVLSNGNQTITFTFAGDPISVQGVQSMHINAGAFTRASDNASVNTFDASFRFDATLLQVASTNPPAGGTFTLPGPFTYDVTFNEPVSPDSVQTTDLVLTGAPGAAVTGVTVLPGNTTARFTISGITTEATLTAAIAAGAITDAFGNPGAAFAASYSTDNGTIAYPTPLVGLNPPGSLIYDPSVTGTVGVPGDTDGFTVALDPQQTATVVVTPTAPGTLVPTVQLSAVGGPVLGSAVGTTAGQKVVLQTVPVPASAQYLITVGGVGASTGGYTLQLILNAAAELESGTAGTNNSRGTAEDLTGSFLSLSTLGGAAQRGAVVGQLTTSTSPAVNLITNGNFETGDFSGWTVSLVGPNGWRINNGSIDPASPAMPQPPISGAFDAFTDPTGPSTRNITQSFTVPATVSNATLSWSDRIQNFANAFVATTQEFRVQILDANNNFLQTVFATKPGDPLIQLGPNSRSVDVTSLLQARAGQVLKLRFEEQDSLFYLNATVDNIALSVSASAPDRDFYAVNLAAGQPVTAALSLSGFTAGAVSFSGTRTDFSTPGLPGQTGTIPLAVAYRDLNGDGKLDMISANGGSSGGPNAAGSIAVRLGNGDGTFGPATLYATGGLFTRFLDLGDVNGDGKLDVVASNTDSNTVSLLLGNGDGTFNAASTYAVDSAPLGLTIRDVNGDGLADVIVPHFNTNDIGVLLGRADGTLGAAQYFQVGAGAPFTTAVGDVNGDGKLDVVTADFNSAAMSVLLGDGAGNFSLFAVLGGQGNNPWGIALADLNGDGKLDVITGNQGSGNIAVRLGNGNGTFGIPTFFSTGGSQPRTIALGDVNGDGKLDVAVPNIGSTNVAVLLGNGNGTFGSPLLFSTNVNPNYATLADVNGDGVDDLSTADAGTNGLGTVSLRLNTTPSVRLELQDAAGHIVAVGSAGASNYDRGLSYVPTAGGTYYLRVLGTTNANYQLVVTRDAVFEAEPNNSSAAAQSISGTHGALGYVNSVPGGGVNTVVPGSLANTEANDNNGFPFNLGGQFVASMRYQQAYDHTQFVSAGTITAIRFRRDGSQFGQPFSTTGLDLKINLGYSAVAFGALSNTFANNVGAGTTTVVDGLVDLSSSGTGTPNPFDIVINLTTPFFYDPSKGDLLMDVFARNAKTTAQFDATDGSQLLGAKRDWATDVNATSGIADTRVLVTRFDFAGSPTSNEDWYALTVGSTASSLRLETSTPADGPNQFINTLNPHIELYRPDGTLAASGTALADGRNESIQFQPTVTGLYKVRVTAEGGTSGEYFLSTDFSPVAADDSASTNEDTPVVIPVLANDADPDGTPDPTTVTITAGPAHGTVSVDGATGNITYTPAANYSGTDSFSYTVKDNGGVVSNVATVSLQVIAVADPPTLSVADATGDEGSAIPLSVSAALTDTDGSESLSITVAGVPAGVALSAGINNGGGTWTLTPAQLTGLTLTYGDNLTFTLTVTATSTEASNGSTASTQGTMTVTIKNVAPTVTSLSKASSINENDTYTLTGTFHDPGTLDTHTIVINWGGGIAGQPAEGTTTLTTAGPNPAGTSLAYLGNGDWQFTASHQYLDDNPTGTPSDNYAIAVTVTDDDTGVGTAATSVTVNNVAPVITSLTGPSPSPGVRGQTLTFGGTFTDVGTLDTHTATFDWGDSTGTTAAAVTEAGGSGSVSATHVYTADGNYTVTLTVRDDDTGTATKSMSVTIAVVALQADPLIPGATDLVVGGGDTTADAIHFDPAGNDGTIAVTLNGVVLGNYRPTGRLIAFGQGGDDDIEVAGGIGVQAWLYGGAGNDLLKGGGGLSMLMGGAGDDTLIGGSGRGLLIGGQGADRLVGGASDDLLIGGTTTYDDDPASLFAVLSEWSSARDYATRVANLIGTGTGPRLNGNTFLTDCTVLDDCVQDQLTGSSGLDWYWALGQDTITDRKPGEYNGLNP